MWGLRTLWPLRDPFPTTSGNRCLDWAARVTVWSDFRLRVWPLSAFSDPSCLRPRAHKLVPVAVLCLVAAAGCLGKLTGGSEAALAGEVGEMPNILTKIYSVNLVEGKFSELPLYGVLRRSTLR